MKLFSLLILAGLLAGCETTGTVTTQVSDVAAARVNAYCLQPQAERVINRAFINSLGLESLEEYCDLEPLTRQYFRLKVNTAAAPDSITIDCEPEPVVQVACGSDVVE